MSTLWVNFMFLNPDHFSPYIHAFNLDDADAQQELSVPNAEAWSFLRQQVPLFECPDAALERAWYFRWWVFRKHLRQTPKGWVISEFLPDVPWAGPHNTTPMAVSHHLHEARWLRDACFAVDDARFWAAQELEPTDSAHPGLGEAVRAVCLAQGQWELARWSLPALIGLYRRWEARRKDAQTGLFWQVDAVEGMPFQLGGSGCRPTINSLQFADARAISDLAARFDQPAVSAAFGAEAGRLRALVLARLWDDRAQCFKTLPTERAMEAQRSWYAQRWAGESDTETYEPPGLTPGLLSPVRELHGLTPWCYDLPPVGYESAWKHLADPKGFLAPYGPTTAERRADGFMADHPFEELWNGPVWPFATTQTLKAMANLLNDYEQPYIGRGDYIGLLSTYARSMQRTLQDEKYVAWIDQSLHPDTGLWLSRQKLHRQGGPLAHRGRDHNASCYADLIITGLIGLRPRPDNILEVSPLVPGGLWDYFCLQDVPYRGHLITVYYDRDGSHYGRGEGLGVSVDGEEVARSFRMERLMAEL